MALSCVLAHSVRVRCIESIVTWRSFDLTDTFPVPSLQNLELLRELYWAKPPRSSSYRRASA